MIVKPGQEKRVQVSGRVLYDLDEMLHGLVQQARQWNKRSLILARDKLQMAADDLGTLARNPVHSLPPDMKGRR